VFEVNNKRVAVSVFTVNENIVEQFDGFYNFLGDVARELAQNSYYKVFLVFNAQLPQESNFYLSLVKFRADLAPIK